MSFKISGFDELMDSLQDLQEKAESLDGKEVPLEELFNPKFLKHHTKASSLDDFFKQGGFVVNCNEDLDNIPEEQLNNYITSTTDFNTWDEMFEAATDDYLDNYLDLD